MFNFNANEKQNNNNSCVQYRQNLNMKRRSQTSSQPSLKNPKPSSHSEAKPNGLTRGNVKPKSTKSSHEKIVKPLKPVKNKVEDYVMIDGNIYKADTNTQRAEVDHFVSRFKRQAIYEIPAYKQKQRAQQYNNLSENTQNQQEIQQNYMKSSTEKVQEFVKKLSPEEKLNLIKQLQKQFGNNPQLMASGSSTLSNNKDIKDMETQDESTEKYNIFSVTLNTLQQNFQSKSKNLTDKINKLFNQGQLTISQRKNKISGVQKAYQRKIKIINCTRSLSSALFQNKKSDNDIYQGHIVEQMMKQLDSFAQIQDFQTDKQIPIRKSENLSEQNISEQDEGLSNVNLLIFPDRNVDDNIDTSGKKSVNEEMLLISPDRNSQNNQKQQDKFECKQQSLIRKFQIPLLLTKQRQQQLDWQRKANAIQKMKIEIDKKISFQTSEIELQTQFHHFTTLADINNFIITLYEYVMKTDLSQVVEKLNFPYGKPITDKLFFLQQNGEIDETEYYPVLDESHLNGYNMEMAFSVRKFEQAEKIHNKAVFDCFNANLNAYRPYYDLEGDVYPWSVSEKGITFYEINEENIQQVFQKTKIKVLQYCSSLCGVIPMGMDSNQGTQILKQKNEELYKKEQRQTLIEQFNKWSIKITDFDAMVRLLVTEEILIQQIVGFVQEISEIGHLREDEPSL